MPARTTSPPDQSMREQGFTLVELVVSITIIGVISLIMAPIFGDMVAAQSSAWRERGKLVNRSISQAFLQYAATISTTGSLPAPHSNAASSLHSVPFNPTDTALGALLQQQQVSLSEVNDDGRNARNVRVYQRVAGLTQSAPLYAQSGPVATLTYDYGVIYSTQCPIADTNCNKATWPRGSSQLTSTNYQTWMPVAPDFGEVHVSSLSIQKQMLAMTAQRADRIRDAFQTYFRGRQIVAASNDDTNFYPNSTTSPSLAVGSPSTNQGCIYSWMALDTSDILDMVGLSKEEYGKTAWGGRFEYCRDYDATGTAGADESPHYGAIRFRKSVSSGSAPDTTTASNNIILSF